MEGEELLLRMISFFLSFQNYTHEIILYTQKSKRRLVERFSEKHQQESKTSTIMVETKYKNYAAVMQLFSTWTNQITHKI